MVAAGEGGADVCVGRADEFPTVVHGHLPRQDDRFSPPTAEHRREFDLEVSGNPLLDAPDGDGPLVTIEVPLIENPLHNFPVGLGPRERRMRGDPVERPFHAPYICSNPARQEHQDVGGEL